MAQSSRERQQAQKQAERPSRDNRRNSANPTTWGRGSESAAQTERLVEAGGERIRHATEASAATARGALRSGSTIAGDAQAIASAWARYAEDVVRHTSEASQALLRARSVGELLEVQVRLLRDNLQSFLNQGTTIAESASRMATRPLNVLREPRGEQARD